MLAGRADADEVRRDGYRRLPVDDRRAAPDLAVEAGRTALERAGLTADRLGLVAHAWIHHQGHDFWSPAHYVASSLGARNAEPVGVQQMCNGGAAALRIALDRMAADPGVEAALVTTADSFPAPGFERWRADYGVAYGDGGTALLLTREHARYRVAGLATVAAPELELMHRGDDAFSAAPRQHGAALDVRRTKKAFLVRAGKEVFAETVDRSLRRAVTGALEQARLGPNATLPVALPRLGRSVLESAYLPALAGLVEGEVLDFGPDTGHLGAGDAAASLAEADARGLVPPGGHLLVISAGAGFTWTALVVQAL